MSSPVTPLGVSLLRQRWYVVASVVAVAAIVAVLAIRLVVVHGRYGEWGLRPSAFPPKVSYHGRDYERDYRQLPATAQLIASDSARIGSTGDGGVIYGPPRETTPTILVVKTAQQSMSYALSGGP